MRISQRLQLLANTTGHVISHRHQHKRGPYQLPLAHSTWPFSSERSSTSPGNGGTSSFGSLVAADGGASASTRTANFIYISGGIGGVAISGQVQANGGAGHSGYYGGYGGNGGSSIFGGGPLGGFITGWSSSAAATFGAGGAGYYGTNSVANPG